MNIPSSTDPINKITTYCVNQGTILCQIDKFKIILSLFFWQYKISENVMNELTSKVMKMHSKDSI